MRDNGIRRAAVFTTSAWSGATASGDGAANSSYDSFASLGGGMLLANTMLGEVAPGARAAACTAWS